MKSILALSIPLLISTLAQATQLDIKFQYKNKDRKITTRQIIFLDHQGQVATVTQDDITITLAATEESQGLVIRAKLHDGQELISEPVIAAPWGFPAAITVEGSAQEYSLEITAFKDQ